MPCTTLRSCRRVSIVIPAYNEESVIRQCLIAAVYQSVPAHEIIVVDNMSKDRTAAIVRQMQLEYPESPIILLSQDRDQGLIPTRNFGLDHATGDILGRIDADSVVEPDWVEQVQKAFGTSPSRPPPARWSTTTCPCAASASRPTTRCAS